MLGSTFDMSKISRESHLIIKLLAAKKSIPMMGWLTLATWKFHVYVRLCFPSSKLRTRDPKVWMSSPEAVRQKTGLENSALKPAGRTETLEPVSIRNSREVK